MTKREIANAIATKVDLPGVVVREAVQMIFDGITETVVQDGGIELRNFGIFQVKKRKARKGRNPRTGEVVAVPSKNVVVFKPGLAMLDRAQSTTGCLQRPKSTPAGP